MNISANEVYGEYERLINENMESNSIGAVYLRESMHRSPLFYKGDFRAKTLQIPKIYTEDTPSQKIGDGASFYRANMDTISFAMRSVRA